MRSSNTNNITPFPTTNRSRYQKQQQIQFQPLSSSSRNQPKTVSVLPKLREAPVWVKALILAQQGSAIAAFCLVSAALGVYSWTVYAQASWGREYDRLEQLQKDQRQMTTANEALKNQIAQQAEAPESGLVLPDFSNTIFLPPAPDRPLRADPTSSVTTPETLSVPIGY